MVLVVNASTSRLPVGPVSICEFSIRAVVPASGPRSLLITLIAMPAPTELLEDAAVSGCAVLSVAAMPPAKAPINAV